MVVASPGCTMTGSGGMGVRFREGTRFATATVVVLPGESLGEDEEVNLGGLEEAEEDDDDLVLS